MNAIPTAENTFGLFVVFFFFTLHEPPLEDCTKIVVEAGNMKHVNCIVKDIVQMPLKHWLGALFLLYLALV